MAKKYIDAEKLKVEIERLRDEYTDIAIDSHYGTVNANHVVADLEQLLAVITSLQQEQLNDVCAEIKEYYGDELAFEDERTKAAYHFFSAGKAFELREYEGERERHIMDLLDNFQKGMNAGYEKAISEMKEGKVECSPVMKEFVNKLFEFGNTYNFGFGPKTIQQDHPEVDLEKEYTEFVVSDPVYSKLVNGIVGKSIARHFYELGLKARKEE